MKHLIFLLFLCLTHLAKGVTYYVANNGNDNNNGTSTSTPWQTLTKVNTINYNAGDQILFNRGDTWYGFLTIVRSGSAGNPIIYGAYGTGNKPVITGFTSITAWTNKGSNIWESTSAVSSLDDCNMVSINGVNTPMGKIPKVFKSSDINLALNKPVSASSYETNDFLPEMAVDGDGNSRWSTGPYDNQWIYVDLGSIKTIEQIQLSWEAAFASSYRIDVSDNLASWSTIYTNSSNLGGVNNILNLGASGRYVRVYCLARATEYGVSLFEISVYDHDAEVSDNVWTTSNGYYIIASHTGMTSLTSNYLTGTPNWAGAKCVTRSNNWTYQGARIATHSGNTLTFSENLEMIDNFGFFIEDDIKCLTAQNDWYFNRTSKKLSIYSTSQPTNVKIATLDFLIDLGASYVTIQDIEFIGSNSSLLLSRWPNSYVSVLNCNLSFTGEDALFFNDNMSNATITGNNIKNTNGVGINFGNTYYHTITNNTLENISIFPGMKVNRDYGSGYAAISFASNTDCSYNNIKNTGYNGIGFGGQNINIHHNYVDSFCTIQSDGGAIYTFKGNLNNVNIYSNILTNGIGNTPGSPSNFGAAGIYMDEESDHYKVYDNSIANCYWYGIQLNVTTGNCEFRNNTIFNGSNYQFYASYWEALDYPLNSIFKKNLLVAKTLTQHCLGFGFANKDPDTGEQIFIQSYVLDSNYYAKPISTTDIVNGNNTNYTLAEWKSFSGEDTHTSATSQTITDPGKLIFIANPSSYPVAYNITSAMDMYGVSYSGSVTLQPWTSKVLITDGAPIDGGQTGGKIIRYNGKLLKHNGKLIKF